MLIAESMFILILTFLHLIKIWKPIIFRVSSNEEKVPAFNIKNLELVYGVNLHVISDA